jgi:diguanylate cyclase (GGDEF)-like protein
VKFPASATTGTIAGAVLLAGVLATGVLRSPLLPLLVPWLAWLATTWHRRLAAAAAGLAALILLLGEILRETLGVRDLVALLAIGGAAAAIALWIRQRERMSRRRLLELDHILAEAERGDGGRSSAEAAVRLTELRRILADIAVRTDASRVLLWTVAPEAAEARTTASSETRVPNRTVALAGNPLGWVWEEGLPVRLDRTPAWAGDGTDVRAFRLHRDEHGGTLATFEFTAGHPPVARALEDAADRLRAEVALHDRAAALAADRRRTAALLETLRRIPSVSAPYAFASELLAGAIELAEGTGGAVAAWHDEAGRILAVAGDDGGPAVGRAFGPLESELALAARSGAEIVRAPREARGSLPVGAPGELWLHPPRALIALPLATQAGAVGALAVWTSIRGRFDTGALDLLRTVAPYAALQLEQAMEYGRLHETAERDPLTGLRNRRAFDRALAREAARLERYGHPIGLLAVDIDHFKQINDRFGHEAGDAVLKDLAGLLESCIRDVDVAARFGGEEFVVLLPETDLAAARDVAERLRTSVESMKKEWSGEPLPIRISVGASAAPTCVPDPKLLVRSADAALYQAKREGRNRVATAASTG